MLGEWVLVYACKPSEWQYHSMATEALTAQLHVYTDKINWWSLNSKSIKHHCSIASNDNVLRTIQVSASLMPTILAGPSALLPQHMWNLFPQ